VFVEGVVELMLVFQFCHRELQLFVLGGEFGMVDLKFVGEVCGTPTLPELKRRGGANSVFGFLSEVVDFEHGVWIGHVASGEGQMLEKRDLPKQVSFKSLLLTGNV